MLRAGLALFVLAAFVFPAQAAPPTSKALERLFDAMYPPGTSDEMYTKVLAVLTTRVKTQIGDGRSPEDAARIYGAVAPKIERLLKEQMGAAAAKKDFIQVYADVFSSEEVQDLITFYESPSGRALRKKSALVLEKNLALMQERVGPLVSELEKIVRDAIAEEEPAGIGAPPRNCFDRPCERP